MELSAAQAVDKAVALLESLDDGKKASDRAVVARAWLDLARYLREDEQRAAAGQAASEPTEGRRIHPDMFTG